MASPRRPHNPMRTPNIGKSTRSPERGFIESTLVGDVTHLLDRGVPPRVLWPGSLNPDLQLGPVRGPSDRSSTSLCNEPTINQADGALDLYAERGIDLRSKWGTVTAIHLGRWTA